MFISIETSTTVCSAALVDAEQCLLSLVDTEGQNHARQLPLFIDELLSYARQHQVKIDAVALSQGPGSYTGLRIGTAMAKGLCYGMRIPLLAIDTLQIMALAATQTINNIPDNALLCPMIDARRMEVYTAIYNQQAQRQTDTEAKIIDADSFADIFQQHQVFFFGNGAAKCRNVITADNAKFIDNIYPLANNMGLLAQQAFETKTFADVAYFDPFYLKEFQPTTPKAKVIF